MKFGKLNTASYRYVNIFRNVGSFAIELELDKNTVLFTVLLFRRDDQKLNETTKSHK